MELEGKEECMHMESRMERRVTMEVREEEQGEDEMSGQVNKKRDGDIIEAKEIGGRQEKWKTIKRREERGKRE